jgi:hypothetical protein
MEFEIEDGSLRDRFAFLFCQQFSGGLPQLAHMLLQVGDRLPDAAATENQSFVMLAALDAAQDLHGLRSERYAMSQAILCPLGRYRPPARIQIKLVPRQPQNLALALCG